MADHRIVGNDNDLNQKLDNRALPKKETRHQAGTITLKICQASFSIGITDNTKGIITLLKTIIRPSVQAMPPVSPVDGAMISNDDMGEQPHSNCSGQIGVCSSQKHIKNSNPVKTQPYTSGSVTRHQA